MMAYMNILTDNHYLLSAKLLAEKVPDFTKLPFSLNLIQNLEGIKLHPKVTFIIFVVLLNLFHPAQAIKQTEAPHYL